MVGVRTGKLRERILLKIKDQRSEYGNDWEGKIEAYQISSSK